MHETSMGIRKWTGIRTNDKYGHFSGKPDVDLLNKDKKGATDESGGTYV